MKVVLFGGSGMVGQGVLRECLLDDRVERVVSVGRSPSGRTDPKLEEILAPHLPDLAGLEDRLVGFDACFFCLGVSSVGKSEADFRAVTYDLTVQVATTLARLDPGMTFVYVSGAGTDSTETGRSMWARVKGATENALLRLPFRAAYMFRPGAIQPRHGVRSKTGLYRVIYVVLFPVLAVVKLVAPNSLTTTESVGRAMIGVASNGAPTKWLGTKEINEAARPASHGPAPPG
ncbi:MAG TPA: epimerase [Thermoplasmata archaeon]|nr:epimerase [Thermoplasmata archaeon]